MEERESGGREENTNQTSHVYKPSYLISLNYHDPGKQPVPGNHEVWYNKSQTNTPDHKENMRDRVKTTFSARTRDVTDTLLRCPNSVL